MDPIPLAVARRDGDTNEIGELTRRARTHLMREPPHGAHRVLAESSDVEGLTPDPLLAYRMGQIVLVGKYQVGWRFARQAAHGEMQMVWHQRQPRDRISLLGGNAQRRVRARGRMLRMLQPTGRDAVERLECKLSACGGTIRSVVCSLRAVVPRLPLLTSGVRPVTQAIVDPEELDRFRGDIDRFVHELEELLCWIQGRFSHVSETWRDVDRDEFAIEFQQLVLLLQSVNSFTHEQVIPFLDRKATHVHEYQDENPPDF